jgi:hypothetical protein
VQTTYDNLTGALVRRSGRRTAARSNLGDRAFSLTASLTRGLALLWADPISRRLAHERLREEQLLRRPRR